MSGASSVAETQGKLLMTNSPRPLTVLAEKWHALGKGHPDSTDTYNQFRHDIAVNLGGEMICALGYLTFNIDLGSYYLLSINYTLVCSILLTSV